MSGTMYNGIISDENGVSVYEDGTSVESYEDGSTICRYTDRKGSMEYIIQAGKHISIKISSYHQMVSVRIEKSREKARENAEQLLEEKILLPKMARFI